LILQYEVFMETLIGYAIGLIFGIIFLTPMKNLTWIPLKEKIFGKCMFHNWELLRDYCDPFIKKCKKCGRMERRFGDCTSWHVIYELPVRVEDFIKGKSIEELFVLMLNEDLPFNEKYLDDLIIREMAKYGETEKGQELMAEYTKKKLKQMGVKV